MDEKTAIIWDEIVMWHRQSIDGLVRTLKDIMQSTHPFGGMVV